MKFSMRFANVPRTILEKFVQRYPVARKMSIERSLKGIARRLFPQRSSSFSLDFPRTLTSTNVNVSPKLKFDILTLNEVYNLGMKSVCHIGAHRGDEVDSYVNNGFKSAVFFEPNPALFNSLDERTKSIDNYNCFNLAVGDFNGMAKLNVASNDGQSSSFLQPKQLRRSNPEIEYIEEVQVTIRTLDSILGASAKYESIVIDVEGYELKVLFGAKETLKNVKYLFIEVHRSETYQDCTRVEEIDFFLKEFGFDRALTRWWQTWGDAFYIRGNSRIGSA